MKNRFARACLPSLVSALAIVAAGCRSRGFNAPPAPDAGIRNISDATRSCQAPISLSGYLKPQTTCYKPRDKEWDTVSHFDVKRKLTPWIPCNSVQLFSMASNAEFDFPAAIRWVAEKPRFQMAQIESALKTPSEQHPDLHDHPALESPNHKAMVNLIRNAKKSLFFNAIIFGGAWGSEIIREMIKRKAEAGIEIVILRDTQNVFAFAAELNPVWDALVRYGVETKGVTVLQSDINARMQSGIPFGLDRITSLFGAFAQEGVSVSGRSDHTKIMVADGFTDRPSMFVASKNPSDYNLLNYDESAIVRGPAAAAALAAFIPDLRLAETLADKAEKRDKDEDLISEEDKELLSRWYKDAKRLADPSPNGLRIQPESAAVPVRLVENNGDDSVRNAEYAVLQLIAGARKNVRIYNFLPYNPMVAKAVADAAARLGSQNVKVMSDATLTYALNVTFSRMVREELEKHGKAAETDGMLKWRLTAAPVDFPKESGRIDITQQQHTKSIIIDDEVLFLGSTNFDFATLGGAFREFSISMRDSKISKESAAIFDRLWNDPKETVGTQTILETGGPTKAKAPAVPLQELLMNIIGTEQARIGALNPRNIANAESCD